MEDLAILVGSCDKNEWLVKIFFDFFQVNWKDCPYNIYLSMESRRTESPGVHVLTDNVKDGWCGRIERALSKIDESYILFMLDDFIIEKKVNQQRIEEYIQRMKKNRIYNVILTEVPNEKNENDSMFPDWLHRNRYGRYKTSLQCGIWDKNIFKNLLKKRESAWEFELYGNIRSFLYRDNNFYALRTVGDKPICYNDGFFMVQGRLNLSEKKRLERENQLEIAVGNGVRTFDADIIRDDIKLLPRVRRRLKIMVLYSVYRLLALMGIDYENCFYNTK